MADIYITEQTAPTTPSNGAGVIWVDSTAPVLSFKDDAGRVHGRSTNASIAAQGPGFAADTWVTDSDILIPSYGPQVRTCITYRISASKTGAGTAAPIYTVRVGSGRSTSDSAKLTLTGPSQTAIADIGTLVIMLVFRTVGGSGVLQGSAWWGHRGTAASTTVSGTGFANDVTGHVEGTSGAIDTTAFPGLYLSLSINGGTSASWTITQVQAEADW